MSYTTAALLLGLAACSGPTRTEPTTQSHPTGALPGEAMPAPGDGGGVVPEPPSESTLDEGPGAARRAEPRDISQAPSDAGVGFDAGAGFDAGPGRDGGIVGGGDAGVGGPR